MRTIGVVTGSRADYGIYLPVLRRIEAEEGLNLALIVTGAHLSPEYGFTVRAIDDDGFPIAARVPMLLSSDTPEAIAISTGLGIIEMTQALAACRPSILLVLGDRYEMMAAALAATPLTIPLAHIHGGERTEGAIDDAFRYAITVLSHLHFAATARYRDNLLRAGEEAWRITVSGAPALDNLRSFSLMARADLEALIGMTLEPPPLVATFHPTTREWRDVPRQTEAVLQALDEVDYPVVFTYPGADTGAHTVIEAMDAFVKRRSNARLVVSLGTRAYFSLLSNAAGMVGNSSSGLIEAASFRLPVVDIGRRQQGRVRGSNVLSAECDRASIVAALRRALSDEFRASLADLANPYGDGRAAERIVDVLRTVPLDARLLNKRSVNVDQ